MAHTYAIDGVRRVVHVRMSGVLTREEVLGTVADLNAASDIVQGSVAIVDLQAVTSVAPIHANDMRDLAGVSLARVGRAAFVAPSPAVFGMARMCAALREMAPGRAQVRVFRSVRDAEAWLELPSNE